MGKVEVRREKIVIPTYEAAEYSKNPMFLEKRVYQGSSGRVYPHPVCENISDIKTNKEYEAIFLENAYILVMLLPEIGGRVQRLYDKTNGYDAVYYNEVIKPALVGLAGPWISGGIEFNWPQHHRPSTFDPVEYAIEEHPDGSVTVWMGEVEKMFHTKGMAGFTVYPDKAYLEIRGQLYNPTDRVQTFLWWANPAVAVNDHTQSIFPPDVHAVTDHGKRAVSTFPIATGTYYKVDYSSGVDISRYKNIPVPTSYMAWHSDYDFIGNYDYGKQAGLLHIADHHVAPGKKQWTWGNGSFGRAWDRNLTDENGPYIELMTGVFTDNQPDFTFLKPYEEKSFVQYFMPYKNVGAVKNACINGAVNLEIRDGKAICSAFTPAELGEVTAELRWENRVLFSETVNLSPRNTFLREELLPEDFCPETELNGLRFLLSKDSKEIISYSPELDHQEPAPSPAEALPEPEELETTEKLFLAAVHLEQYRHATRSPEPYYLEGLKRDPSDIRLNNGYGKYLYQKGCYEKALEYFRRAADSSIWKNPNPYDCEPFYNLGLAYKALGKKSKAYDAFYRAAWDGSMQNRAFYQLACLSAGEGRYSEALEFTEKSLLCGAHHLKARNLKTTLLRLLDRTEEAISFAEETCRIDPLDTGCRYELYLLFHDKKRQEELKALLREDSQNYIELSLNYREAYLFLEAASVLELCSDSGDPMVHYHLYSNTKRKDALRRAEQCSSHYCFPNRLEDMEVLQEAVRTGGKWAGYYLGELLYDRGRWEEAVELWEACCCEISLPTVWRNLALAYYNKRKDGSRAREAMERAFSMDPTDARVFYELDQLYKVLNLPYENRLAQMEAHQELLAGRDDLYTEYVTLLNLDGQYQKALAAMEQHRFHPWEGGEGKITAQYRIARVGLAKEVFAEKPETAEAHLQAALCYPENLGEGKLAGAEDQDIDYLLGCLRQGKAGEDALRRAARGPGEISAAVYYNDQPPEMLYYSGLALGNLGREREASECFRRLREFGLAHEKDEIKIDYFAVSLPDFLIFEGDRRRKNRVDCCFLTALGYLGESNWEEAARYAEKGLEEDQSHFGLRQVRKAAEQCRSWI